MGQYHYLVNFDRKEIVHPHKLGLGLKQVEHTHCVASLSDVLYMLLSSSPNRGGCDLYYDPKLEKSFKTFGRWIGDKVVVFGDYTEWSDIPFIHTNLAKTGLPGNIIFDEESAIFSDITNHISPAFCKAFDLEIEIEIDEYGQRDRKLSKNWNWLLGASDGG